MTLALSSAKTLPVNRPAKTGVNKITVSLILTCLGYNK
jgi:hypothetical protein